MILRQVVQERCLEKHSFRELKEKGGSPESANPSSGQQTAKRNMSDGASCLSVAGGKRRKAAGERSEESPSHE